jgi:hypothetical protein
MPAASRLLLRRACRPGRLNACRGVSTVTIHDHNARQFASNNAGTKSAVSKPFDELGWAAAFLL